MESQCWVADEEERLARALGDAGLVHAGPSLREAAGSLAALTSDLRRAVAVGDERWLTLRYFEAARLLRALGGQVHPESGGQGEADTAEAFLRTNKLARYKAALVDSRGMAMVDVPEVTDGDLVKAGIEIGQHRARFLTAAGKLPLHYQDCDGDHVMFRLADSGGGLQKVVNGGSPKVTACAGFCLVRPLVRA